MIGLPLNLVMLVQVDDLGCSPGLGKEILWHIILTVTDDDWGFTALKQLVGCHQHLHSNIMCVSILRKKDYIHHFHLATTYIIDMIVFFCKIILCSKEAHYYHGIDKLLSRGIQTGLQNQTALTLLFLLTYTSAFVLHFIWQWFKSNNLKCITMEVCVQSLL